jgi:hypothetical protein
MVNCDLFGHILDTGMGNTVSKERIKDLLKKVDAEQRLDADVENVVQ